MENTIFDKVKIRKLNKNDSKLFIDLRLVFIKEHFDNMNESEIDFLKSDLSIYFNKHIENEDFIGMIGEYDEKIISVAYLTINEYPPSPNRKNGKGGTLLNVYTFPKYRKKGITKKLIENIIEEAKIIGVNLIELKASNDGYNLYKDIGFIDDNDYKNMKMKL